MSPRKGLLAIAAMAAVPALAVPVATAGAQLPVNQSGQTCLTGFADPGPFGPAGPYGQSGPYGPDGPLHGRPNPIGDAASCGGLLTYLIRGGNVTSFVNGNLASVGITPPAGR